MKSRKVIPNKVNRMKPKRSPYSGFMKTSKPTKPRIFMMILYYLIAALMLAAIFFRLRHYFVAHWK